MKSKTISKTVKLYIPNILYYTFPNFVFDRDTDVGARLSVSEISWDVFGTAFCRVYTVYTDYYYRL